MREGVDVVGVVTSLFRGGAQVVLHGGQVVELSVLLGVHEKGEVEEDGEGQVESRKGGRRSQRETHMDDYADGMRLKNTLSHEVHVTQTSRGVTKLRAPSACSQVVQLARVGVRVLVVDVVCVMLILIARVVVHAVDTRFSWPVFCSWRCTLYTQAARPACKTQQATRHGQGGHTLQRAFPRHKSQRIMEQARRGNVQTLGQLQRNGVRSRLLLVPRVDVVRKCSLICPEQEQAHKITPRPPSNVFLAECCSVCCTSVCLWSFLMERQMA